MTVNIRESQRTKHEATLFQALATSKPGAGGGEGGADSSLYTELSFD